MTDAMRGTRRGDVLLALCLAVLGIVVLLHVALSVVAPAHAAHAGHLPHAGQGIAVETAAGHGGLGAYGEHGPCPQRPGHDDHTLCGAAAGVTLTGERTLLAAGPTCCEWTGAQTGAVSPAPVRRSSQPARLPRGTAVLLLKSVSRT
ncbi:hypothetical protein Misp01_16080 [Microtetraspora sp. NBRC 13810]|uniref:hypothetical protein n=1 Tax=Microtetraspora sp. NBRC 13810 TaxID=3030990 RepID=UPI0024A2792E|nr:hypothetical protein [Microtetraspora sp. NBRC 13810]GLW06478.1 hypothetical protein Misp01_16080 [Microtetraspora sp. NBRC 13810]